VLSNLLLIHFLSRRQRSGWSLVVVLADDAGQRACGSGRHTGIYYISSQTAEVVGPLLVGALLSIFFGGHSYRLVSGWRGGAPRRAMWMRGVRRVKHGNMSYEHKPDADARSTAW